MEPLGILHPPCEVLESVRRGEAEEAEEDCASAI